MSINDLRVPTIESAVKSAATLYAHANARYGEPLPKIRFVFDIPFLLQVNFTHRRRFGWKNHSLMDAFGIDMAADLDELRELMSKEQPWDVLMVSFPHQQDTQYSYQAVISYHRSREEEVEDDSDEEHSDITGTEQRKPRHRAK